MKHDGGLGLCSGYFAGKPRMAAVTIICPDLIAHVSKMAAGDAETLEQQRRALEFRSNGVRTRIQLGVASSLQLESKLVEPDSLARNY